ncbi:hypothetical protein AXA44_29665 [Rhodococcus sp. SC4]|nr:hypothetical protein AXA44_29665 [Rhodococcus sp. SC4]
MIMTLDEMRAEFRQHETTAREILTRADGQDLQGEDADAFDTAATRMEQLSTDIRDGEQRITRMKLFAQNNPGCLETAQFGQPSEQGRHDQRPAGTRDAALRQLERVATAHALPTHAADKADHLIRSGSPAAQDLAARWVSATGAEAYSRAFAALCADPTRGHLQWGPEEAQAYREVTAVHAELHRRDMTVGTGSEGGMLVPLHLDPSILLSSDGSTNPLRKIARVVQVTGTSWRGVSSAGAQAEWVPEAAEVADASPTLAQPTVPVHKGDAFVPFSFELGDDGQNFLSELQGVLVDAADQLMAQAFTNGSGNGQPTGLVTKVAGTSGSVVPPATAETFSAADIFAVQNSLPPRWQPRAQWTANLSIINAAKQFETTNGSLKFPEIATGQLLGRALNENSSQDGAPNAGVTGVANVLVYGDFQQFLIVDRIGTSLEVIPHLFGENRRPTLQRGGLLWFRTGSNAIVPEAFRVLSIPTAATAKRGSRA